MHALMTGGNPDLRIFASPIVQSKWMGRRFNSCMPIRLHLYRMFTHFQSDNNQLLDSPEIVYARTDYSKCTVDVWLCCIFPMILLLLLWNRQTFTVIFASNFHSSSEEGKFWNFVLFWIVIRIHEHKIWIT